MRTLGGQIPKAQARDTCQALGEKRKRHHCSHTRTAAGSRKVEFSGRLRGQSPKTQARDTLGTGQIQNLQ